MAEVTWLVNYSNWLVDQHKWSGAILKNDQVFVFQAKTPKNSSFQILRIHCFSLPYVMEDNQFGTIDQKTIDLKMSPGARG